MKSTQSKLFKTILLNICLICAPSLSDAKEPSKLQDYLASCQQNLDNKDYVAAITECRKALQLDPKNAEAYNNIGLAYAAADDPNFALSNADQAIALDSQRADYYGNRAAYETRLGLLGPALTDFEKALELNPNNAQYYADRGAIYEQLTLLEPAIADYNKAVQLDPKLALPYKALTKFHYDKGNIDQVLSNSSKFLKFQPDDQETLIMRARMLKVKHDKIEPTNEQLLVDALADCTRAEAKDPNHAPAHACLASVYLSKNEFGPSIASATKAIDLGLQEGVFVTRAIAYFKIKDYVNAKKDVANALSLEEVVHPKFVEDLNKAIAAEAAAAEEAATKAAAAAAAYAATPEGIAAAKAAEEKAAKEAVAAAEAAKKAAEKAAEEAAVAEAAAALKAAEEDAIAEIIAARAAAKEAAAAKIAAQEAAEAEYAAAKIAAQEAAAAEKAAKEEAEEAAAAEAAAEEAAAAQEAAAAKAAKNQ